MSSSVIDDADRGRTSFQEAAASAQQLAEQAAARSGVQIRTIQDQQHHHAASAVLQSIWGYSSGAPLSPETLHAFAYTGNYVGVAFAGEEIVAVASAFRTDHGSLHSHIAGVLPAYQGRSIGYVLKLHQRAWALRRGIGVISWTFDPLMRRNAHFNLIKLGARVAQYIPDFYGPMDGINSGDHSDRLLVEWDLFGSIPGKPVARPDGAATVLGEGDDGAPVVRHEAADSCVLQVPGDAEALRRNDPALAARWREALRDTLGSTLSGGRRIIGLDVTGAYVIGRDWL